MMKQLVITLNDEVEKIESSEVNETLEKNCTHHRSHYSLISQISSRIQSNDIFFSLEFLPPRTHYGVQKLLERFYKIQDGGPLFCSVTWHTGNVSGSKKETSTLSLAASMSKAYCFDTMIHLAACNLTKYQVKNYLRSAYSNGIRNVLALRGDVPSGWVCPADGFPHAADLVRFIRDIFGDMFTIAVAGYPSGHPEAKSYEEDLMHLKEKVDAGADFVISQIFFSADTFKRFYSDCKVLDIRVPIIPGILPILTFSSLWRICQVSHLEIPPEILKPLLPISHNDEAVINFGIYFAIKLGQELLTSTDIPGLHFFTLNREEPTIEVCKQLGLWSRGPYVLPSILRPNNWIDQFKVYLKYYRSMEKDPKNNKHLSRNMSDKLVEN